jgi:antitoxin component YwqK of YwqJK toxin-antitoxin module
MSVITRYRDGSVEEYTIADEKCHGDYKSYHQNGTPRNKRHYVNGKLHGESVSRQKSAR